MSGGMSRELLWVVTAQCFGEPTQSQGSPTTGHTRLRDWLQSLHSASEDEMFWLRP